MDIKFNSFLTEELKTIQLLPEGTVIKSKINYLFENSPSSSNLEFHGAREGKIFKIHFRISSYNKVFSYQGLHSCLVSGILTALNSLIFQTKKWKHKRVFKYLRG